ncbi:MAG: cyclic nucleotide-binding domain-containing protein [Candidatus Glassbacteria bacterium]
MLSIKKNFKSGEIIVRENTLGNSAYIIDSGRVEVSKNIGNQRIVFTTLEKGMIFGEMSLVDNSPRSATVTAITDTTVTVLSKANFQQFLKQNTAVSTIFRVLTDRLRETDVMVCPLRLTNFYYSLASLIYYLSRSNGQRVGDELRIEEKFLIDECCTILAIDRSYIEKVVNRLAFTKLIKLEKDYLKGIENRYIFIPSEELFYQFVEFLKRQSVKEDGEENEDFKMLSDNEFSVLRVLVDNIADYQPETGRNSTNYERYLDTAKDLAKISTEEADKIIQKHVTSGLFKFTVDTENQTRLLVCNRPEELEKDLARQAGLRTLQKMVNLLKTLASN